MDDVRLISKEFLIRRKRREQRVNLVLSAL